MNNEFWSSTSESEEEDSATNEPTQVQRSTIQNIQHIVIHLDFFSSGNISNAAITVFLKAFKHFVLLGRALGCAEFATDIARQIPMSHETLHRRLNIDRSSHIDYVVRPKCHSIYERDDYIITHANGSVESKTCRHVATPEHPHHSKRNACGCVLMKKQKTKRGS